MYRLLIVTEKQAVWDMFAKMSGWETLGFKQPRLRKNTAEALECMEKHAIDAIAIEDSAALNDLKTYVDERYPLMLRFPIASNAEEQLHVIKELDRMLGILRADHFNDDYDAKSALWIAQERLLKTIVCGLVPTEKELDMKLRMLRCPEAANVPCILARLGMNMDDPFLTDRWHYGSERLETALRNFFGVQQDGMTMHIAVISPEEVRLLCYPEQRGAQLDEEQVTRYVNDTMVQISRYLGLEMNILEIRKLPGLCAFAMERATA
ncbi:MAG: hypothetical protein PHI98_12060 [Eubacteriales bacterium]|nr:hypothetical protein [Eubacteriales bacterium]